MSQIGFLDEEAVVYLRLIEPLNVNKARKSFIPKLRWLTKFLKRIPKSIDFTVSVFPSIYVREFYTYFIQVRE